MQNPINKSIPGFTITVLNGWVSVIFPGMSSNLIFLYWHNFISVIKNEINTHIVKKPNLRVFEKVKQFTLLKESFSVENGLMSATQKVKRNKVFEKYEDVIGNMYNK